MLQRVRDRLRLAKSLQARRSTSAGRRTPTQGRVASWTVVVLAGVMFSASAVTSKGSDLRPSRNADLVDLVSSQARKNAERNSRAGVLRGEVDALSKDRATGGTLDKDVAESQAQAAMTAVKGPGVRVTLSDAPLSVKPEGVDGDLLVVHQQDIQMVANVLWEAGAEAMTIQDQRITSVTGIKCVGNTVVLRGVPYAPPYRITAIGDPARLSAALASSEQVRIYKQYVDAYHLGWSEETLDEVEMPAYEGSVELKHAKVPES